MHLERWEFMLEDGGTKLGAKGRDVPKEGLCLRIVTPPHEGNVLFLVCFLRFLCFS